MEYFSCRQKWLNNYIVDLKYICNSLNVPRTCIVNCIKISLHYKDSLAQIDLLPMLGT